MQCGARENAVTNFKKIYGNIKLENSPQRLRLCYMSKINPDAVPRLPEHRLPTRPVMNSGPPCFGSHRDWKII